MPSAPEPKFTDPNLSSNQQKSDLSQELDQYSQIEDDRIKPNLVSTDLPDALSIKDIEHTENQQSPSNTVEKTADKEAASKSVMHTASSTELESELTLSSDLYDHNKPFSHLGLRLLFFNWTFGVIVLFLLSDAFVSLPIFQLKTLKFEGLEHVSPRDLKVKVDLNQLHPLIVNPKLSQIEERALSHPWIKKAQASLTWQGHIKLKVTEHKATAIAVLDELKVVNSDGQPFANALPSEILDLPLISGLPPELFNRSQKEKLIGQYWLSQGIELAHLIKSIGLDKQRKLSDIHISETGRYEIMLDKIRISLGLDMLKERLIEVEKILNQLDRKGVTAAYILLSDDLNRAIVKEVPITADDAESLK